MLKAQNISLELGEKSILNVDQMEISAGEIVGLIGPNGSGKTTLLRSLLAMGPRAKGACNLWEMGAKLRSQYAGWLAQEREVSWDLSVKEVIELGRLPWQGMFGARHADDQSAFEFATRAMDVTAFLGRNIASLSGGERARVLIARLLAQKPKLLLADEPIAALDPAHQLSTMSLFRDCARAGQGVLVSIHDLGMAAQFCDRLILLHEGAIKAEGKPSEVLTDACLAEYFSIRAYKNLYEGKLILQPIDDIKAPAAGSKRTS